MEYYSAIKRNKYEPAELRWMNLEPIIVKENKHYMLTHIYGIRKNEPIYRKRMETETWRTGLWTQWGKERVG